MLVDEKCRLLPQLSDIDPRHGEELLEAIKELARRIDDIQGLPYSCRDCGGDVDKKDKLCDECRELYKR